MLWLMRRPWMKRLQRASIGWMKPERRERVWESMQRQNAFALRYGLGILTVAVYLLLLSFLFTGSYFLLLSLQERGVLSVPNL